MRPQADAGFFSTMKETNRDILEEVVDELLDLIDDESGCGHIYADLVKRVRKVIKDEKDTITWIRGREDDTIPSHPSIPPYQPPQIVPMTPGPWNPPYPTIWCCSNTKSSE